jgi:hypothetical protein
VKMKIDELENVLYKDGQPCSRKGCAQHVSHPCEECGRFRASGIVLKSGKVVR